MGLTNSISSILGVRKLIDELEKQVMVTQRELQAGAPAAELRESLSHHERIHQELSAIFGQSRAARMAIYTLFDEKAGMGRVMSFSSDMIHNLKGVIDQRDTNR